MLSDLYPSVHSEWKRLRLVASSMCMVHACVLRCFSCVRLCVTPWTVAQQAFLFMGFSRQEHWSGLPCPLPGDLPDPGIKPTSLTSSSLAGRLFTTRVTWETLSAWWGIPVGGWSAFINRILCWMDHPLMHQCMNIYPPLKWLFLQRSSFQTLSLGVNSGIDKGESWK